MLLINPRKRGRKARKASVKRASPARKRVRRVRKSNPLTVASVKRIARRRAAPRKVTRSRRRRNPISRGGIGPMLKSALIGGAGAVAMDVGFAQVSKYLPASMQYTGPTSAGAAVKVGLTILAGRALSKATRGMSEKMAAGSLVVQAADLVRSLSARFAPGVVPGVSGIGYASPAAVIRGTSRISPLVRTGGVGAFQRRGSRSPLLNGVGAFTPGSPIIGQRMGARARDAARR